MHYNTTSAAPVPDQTRVELTLEDEVETPAMIQPWADPAWIDSEAMRLPAGQSGVTHGFSYTLPADFRIWTANLHMHTYGVRARLSVERGDGGEDCLLEIPAWDFNWQRTHVLAAPYEFSAGDTLSLECEWDNTTDQDIFWGDRTGDEMCLATMMWTY